MPRPKLPRCVRHEPNVYFFKPKGIPLKDLEVVELLSDELEALKLSDSDNLDQTSSANKMNISQPTFARLLASARRKVSDAVVFGKAIKIQETEAK